MKQHIAAVYEDNKPFKCDISGYSFSLKQQMKLHVAKKHKGKQKTVLVCKRSIFQIFWKLRWLWIPNITLVALSKCVEGVEEGIELFVSSAASWL